MPERWDKETAIRKVMLARRAAAPVPLFHCTRPCGICPYRTDSPVQLWERVEFERVLETEADPLGALWKCHLNNGGVCVGFLMDQDRRRVPSIMLRLALIQYDVTTEFLDSLSTPAPLYESVEAMVRANYPELLKEKSDATIEHDFPGDDGAPPVQKPRRRRGL